MFGTNPKATQKAVDPVTQRAEGLDQEADKLIEKAKKMEELVSSSATNGAEKKVDAIIKEAAKQIRDIAAGLKCKSDQEAYRAAKSRERKDDATQGVSVASQSGSRRCGY